MNLTELRTHIKQHFGYPMVEVELNDAQLNGVINQAYNFHKKWGIGHSTQEVFFTKSLSAGVREYDMPAGVHSVIDVKDYSSNMGSSSELFTINSTIYQQFVNNISGFSLVDYELAMQFVDMLERYQVSRFSWTYHSFNNTLLLSPTPSTDDMLTYDYMMMRCFIEEGYKIDDDTQDSDWREHLYDDPWMQEYCIALAKIVLGHIRRKFTGFDSIGNAGINMDGGELVSEGKEEKMQLEEEFKESTWEGLDITFG